MARIGIIFLVVFCLSISFPLMAMNITRIEPSPDSVVTESIPTLSIYFVSAKSSELKADKIKFFLNGKEVTWKCLILQNCVTCKPSYPLPEGKNTIKFIYYETKPVEYEWSFIIQSKNNMHGELTHNGTDEAFQEGDSLDVELKTLSGGIACFNIGDWKQDIPMKEETPGVYKGTYKIEKLDNAKGQSITARLRTGSGKILEFESQKKITISAYFFKVKIMSPANDSVVNNYFDITGRTRPSSKVSLAPQMVFTGGIGTNTSPGSMGAIEVMADEKGYFKVHYGFPIKISGMCINFIVSARDPDGNIAIPMTFSVKVK